MSRANYWYDSKVSGSFGTSWTYLKFGSYVTNMVIIAPNVANTDDIFYSWDGQTIAGRVPESSYALNLQNVIRNGIWIKANSGTQDATITAY